MSERNLVDRLLEGAFLEEETPNGTPLPRKDASICITGYLRMLRRAETKTKEKEEKCLSKTQDEQKYVFFHLKNTMRIK